MYLKQIESLSAVVAVHYIPSPLSNSHSQEERVILCIQDSFLLVFLLFPRSLC